MIPASSPPRVLFVDHTAERSGGEIALLRLLRNLDRSRVTPVVLLFEDGPIADDLRAVAEVYLLPVRPGLLKATRSALGWRAMFRFGDAAAMLGTVREVARQIRELRVDLVHTNSLKSDIIGGLAARLARRPLVWHLRDRLSTDYLRPAQAVVMSGLARVLPQAVICVSEGVRQTLLSAPAARGLLHSSAFASRVFVVHDGMERGELSPEDTGATSDGRNAVGLVGRISPWKGQDVFIRAAALLQPTHPHLEFRIIGGSMFQEKGWEERLHALVEELGVGSAVKFTGFVRDVPQRIAHLDLLVHASTTGEPFGLVLVEAMAAGKAVVASRGGGVPEIVQEGVTGLLTPMGDVAALADAIAALMDYPERRKAFGRAGRQRVEELFLMDRSCAGVLAVYDKVLRGRSQGRSAPPPAEALGRS